MTTDSGIDWYKDDSDRPMGNISFENFSTFSPIPLIWYEHENIVSALQFYDEIKPIEVYQICYRIKRRFSRI